MAKVRSTGCVSLSIVALQLLFLSLVRISNRDPLSGSLGIQSLYELSLQFLAILIILFVVIKYRVPIPLWDSLPWLAYGIFLILSSLWAPNVVLAFTKALQLLMLFYLVAVIAETFDDGNKLLKVVITLNISTLFFFLFFGVYSEGLTGIWKAYEVGNLLYEDGGRFRLSIAEIHPAALSQLLGILVLLSVIIDRKNILLKRFSIILLFGSSILAGGRSALILSSIILFYYLINYINMNFKKLAFFIRLAAISLGLVLLLEVFLNNEVLKALELQLSQMTDLNGRTTLWFYLISDILEYDILNIFVGNGFASFRYYGLEFISYAGEAHNAPLQILFETGVVGLFLWILAIGMLVRTIWKSQQTHRIYFMLPAFYILVLGTMGSDLADSRSFPLILLWLYSAACTKLKKGGIYECFNGS